jgi:hypothetical protein
MQLEVPGAHSLLRAATDTEIETSSNKGLHVSKVMKQRDFQAGDEFAFKLNQGVLGQDKYGYSISTCVPTWY